MLRVSVCVCVCVCVFCIGMCLCVCCVCVHSSFSLSSRPLPHLSYIKASSPRFLVILIFTLPTFLHPPPPPVYIPFSRSNPSYLRPPSPHKPVPFSPSVSQPCKKLLNEIINRIVGRGNKKGSLCFREFIAISTIGKYIGVKCGGGGDSPSPWSYWDFS